jgi:hypothetical protein
VTDTEKPKYTESDMRVLTEAALRLGRKEMAEELAKAFEERRPLPGWGVFSRQADITTAARMVRLYARDLLPQAAPDATSARTEPPAPSDLPPEPQAVREPRSECPGCGTDGTGLESHNRDCPRNPYAREAL